MSLTQCTYAALNTMIQTMRRVLWGADQSGYYSKTLQTVQHGKAYRHKASIMYYCHPPMPETPQCTLTATEIICYVLIFLFALALLYLITKMLLDRHKRFNQRTASALIDEMEVELATIDSIDEFEKLAGTSDEGISVKQRHLFRPDDTNTTFRGSASSDQTASFGQGIMGVYSLFSQPIRNMFLKSSGYGSNSTNSRGAQSTPKQYSPPCSHKKDTHSPRRGRGSANNPASSEMPKRGTLSDPSKRVGVNSQLPRGTGGKKLKDCSVNTEIRINNISFTSIEKTSDNETDLEKELALIDAPGKYYYEKCRNDSGHLNKRRKQSQF